MAEDDQRLAAAAIVLDMITDPANGLGNIFGFVRECHRSRKRRGPLKASHPLVIAVGPRGRPQAIIDGNEDVALFGKCLGLVIHLRFVAAMPAPAMNPDRDGMIGPYL